MLGRELSEHQRRGWGVTGVKKIETTITQRIAQVLGVMGSVETGKLSEGVKRERKIPSPRGVPEERLEHLNWKSLPA